jgi:hypothetical protein
MYYPYSYDDLSLFLQEIKGVQGQSQPLEQGGAYLNEETIVYSYERRKIQLLTITSYRNIESYYEKEPCPSEEIFPHPKDRPFKYLHCN